MQGSETTTTSTTPLKDGDADVDSEKALSRKRPVHWRNVWQSPAFRGKTAPPEAIWLDAITLVGIKRYTCPQIAETVAYKILPHYRLEWPGLKYIGPMRFNNDE